MAYTTIKKPSDYFNTKLYTGNGSTQSITGVNFQPDFVWIKDRSVARDHYLYDSVRGVNKNLFSNLANAESTDTNALMSYDTDGFTLGGEAGVGASGETFVSWNWLGANGTASNTDGSINSTVSASVTSGFSIVKFTGTGANATVGHGLGAKPNVIILKSYENPQQWSSYWSVLGATKYMRFNTTDGESTASNRWNNTEPTTSVFTVSTDGEVNTNGQNQIAYCFTEKQGYSKFGSYTGNGSTDGTFVYTGFKPAFVIVKRTDGFNDWILSDNKRFGYNGDNKRLYPNQNYIEDAQGFDLLSNGFKATITGTTVNGSGNSYIYMCFAEQPLVGDNPATAR